MKKSIAATIFCCAASFAAQAEIIQIPTTCVTSKELVEVLLEFDETASLTMTSNRADKNNILEHNTVLFINYETKTWTLVEQFSKNKFCVTAAGENVRPYVKK
jgi:hypothetical protein